MVSEKIWIWICCIGYLIFDLAVTGGNVTEFRYTAPYDIVTETGLELRENRI